MTRILAARLVLGGLLVAILLTLSLWAGPRRPAGADSPFEPTFAETADNSAPDDPSVLPAADNCVVGAPCKLLFHLQIPDGQPDAAIRLTAPLGVVSGADPLNIPDGAIVGREVTSIRVGPIGNCGAGSVVNYDILFYDATFDPATTTGSFSDLASFDHWATQLNGVRDTVLIQNPGATLRGRTLAVVPGSPPLPLNRLSFSLAGGTLLVVPVVGDPTGPPSTIQACGPRDTRDISLGVTRDNPDTPADEGGIARFSCATAGTQTVNVILDRNDTPPGDTVALFDTFTCSPNTPPGSDISVPLLGGTGNLNGLEVTFASVASEGSTSASGGSAGPPPPTGFQVVGLSGAPIYYDINTTAAFTGPVAVCVRYDDTGLTQAQEASLTLMQFDGTFWTDRTTSVDTAANIICGAAPSLSTWAAMLPPVVGGKSQLLLGRRDNALSDGEDSRCSLAECVAVVGLPAALLAGTAGAWYTSQRLRRSR